MADLKHAEDVTEDMKLVMDRTVAAVATGAEALETEQPAAAQQAPRPRIGQM